MAKERVLVTGAGGFIGSHLTERLVVEGFRVKAFVHYNSQNNWGLLELLSPKLLKEVEVISGDIQDSFAVKNAVLGCEVVLHLSSLIAIPYSYIAPQSFFATNVMGALNVMQASLQAGVKRIVHTSTSECYGTAQYAPIDEKHPLQGQSPYSASKIGADMVAESFHRSFGLPVAIIRPFNTYGPRQSARAVIPNIVSQALAGVPIRLGLLTPTRDMNFVSDIVDAFMRMATVPGIEGEIINIGSGCEISIGDLATLIFRTLGCNAIVEQDNQRIRPSASEVGRLLCDNSKARRLLSWEPQTSLAEGIAKTIEWFRSNEGRYKLAIYNI